MKLSGSPAQARYSDPGATTPGLTPHIPLIEFKGVSKRFGSRTVLDRVDLQIYERQITAIIGLSGSGKSVLLKRIIRLLKPDEGSILFRGKPLHDLDSLSTPGLPKSVKVNPMLNWSPS